MVIELDERGSVCPAPVIALGKVAKDARANTEIVIFSDDPAAETDIPAWCRLRGAQFLGSQTADGGGKSYRVRTT